MCRCAAHKENGEQCRNSAMRGARVCGYHGGKAPQVKAAARRRLEKSADRMARELLKMAIRGDSAMAAKGSTLSWSVAFELDTRIRAEVLDNKSDDGGSATLRRTLPRGSM